MSPQLQLVCSSFLFRVIVTTWHKMWCPPVPWPSKCDDPTLGSFLEAGIQRWTGWRWKNPSSISAEIGRKHRIIPKYSSLEFLDGFLKPNSFTILNARRSESHPGNSKGSFPREDFQFPIVGAHLRLNPLSKATKQQYMAGQWTVFP